MLELHDVWKGARKTALGSAVLTGASVTLPAGRKIGMLGANRNDNSMVLRLLSGVEDPDKGAVRRVGVPCWPFDYSGFCDNGATVRQNANFLGRVYGVDAAEVVRIVETLSGVRPVRGKQMKYYLAVERKALELGLSLAIQFDWYFVDERLPRAPEVTGDAVQAVIADRISRASLIWASTSPNALRKFCDAGLVLDQGLLTFYDHFDEAAEVYDSLIAPEDKAQNDGQLGGKRRERRAARRARQNSAQEPV